MSPFTMLSIRLSAVKAVPAHMEGRQADDGYDDEDVVVAEMPTAAAALVGLTRDGQLSSTPAAPTVKAEVSNEQPDEQRLAPALAISRKYDGALVTRCHGEDLDLLDSTYIGPIRWCELGIACEMADTAGTDKVGTLTLRDSSVYCGQFKNGLRHGRGEWRNSDGDAYSGEWNGDKAFGAGKLTFAAGGYVEGEWADGYMNGQGKKVWADGSSFEGQFFRDVLHGHGKKYSPPDPAGVATLIREGQWRDGKEFDPPQKPVARREYKYAERLVEQPAEDGDRFVLAAKENETMRQIAKELGNGCTAELLVELNQRNPILVGLDRPSAKFKPGVEVWLPRTVCASYLAAARVAKAEERAHKAEAEGLKAAAEAKAAAVAATAAAGPRHQARWPLAVGEGVGEGVEEVPDAAAVEERLEQLDGAMREALAQQETLQAQIESMRGGLLATAIPTLEAADSVVTEKLARCAGMKRTLQAALSDDATAAEAERSAAQQRRSSQQALAAAWRSSASWAAD
jgi:hypothetical protein